MTKNNKNVNVTNNANGTENAKEETKMTKNTYLTIPVMEPQAFGNTSEHQDVLERNMNEVEKYFNNNSKEQYFVIEDIQLYDAPKKVGVKYPKIYLGYVDVEVLSPSVFFVSTMQKVEDKWREVLIDVFNMGVDFNTLGKRFNKFVKEGSTFQHQLNKSGVVRIPIISEGENIVAKIPMTFSSSNGSDNYYHSFKLSNPKGGDKQPSDKFNQYFMAVVTQAVRTVCGEAKTSNTDNNVLRGTKCTSLIRFFTKDQVDEAKGYSSDMAIFESYTTAESSKIGSMMPSYVCRETEQFLDLEAIREVNEASRTCYEAVLTSTDEDNDNPTQVRYVGKDEVLIGGKIVNKYEHIANSVNAKCVECPLFQECGVKSQKQIAEEKEAKGSDAFVSYTWEESMKPEHATPIIQTEESQVINYPQNMSELNSDFTFALKSKKGHVIVVPSEFVNHVVGEGMEEVDFNENKVKVNRLLSQMYSFGFKMHRYNENIVAEMYSNILDSFNDLDFNSIEVDKKSKQLSKALDFLENKYAEFKSSNGKIVTEFGDFIISLAKAKEEKSIGFKFANIKLSKVLNVEYFEAVTKDEETAQLFYCRDSKEMGGLFNAIFEAYLDKFMYTSEFHKMVITNDVNLSDNEYYVFVEAANAMLFKKVNESIYLQNKHGVNDVDGFNPILREYMISRLYN